MTEPLGDQIFRARERAGMTQDQLADLVGVVGRTISAYEAGRHLPRPEVVRRLANALKTKFAITPQPRKAAVAKPPKPKAEAKRSPSESTAGKRPCVEVAGPSSSVSGPKKKGWPTPAEIASIAAEVRRENAARDCRNYIRLFAHEERGVRGDLFVYTFTIGTSKPVTPREMLLALRQSLGDPQGFLDGIGVQEDGRER